MKFSIQGDIDAVMCGQYLVGAELMELSHPRIDISDWLLYHLDTDVLCDFRISGFLYLVNTY